MSIALKLLKIAVARLLLSTALITSIAGWSIAVQSSELESDKTKAKLIKHDNDRELQKLKERIHLGINEYRASLDLPPLNLNAEINHQAEIHSHNMAQQVVKFSHQGFKGRIKALEGQITYRRAAENVAFNQGFRDPAETAIAGWIKSENHHLNIIGNFDLTGIGAAKNKQGEYYFTQIFIKEQ